jgi:hypothetical protein
MTDLLPIPAEVEIFGVYWPPLLLAVILGTIAMVVTIRLLNRHRLSRFFVLPEFVMLAMIALYTVTIGTFLIPI